MQCANLACTTPSLAVYTPGTWQSVQEGQKFKDILGYKVSSRPVWDALDTVSKQTNKKTQEPPPPPQENPFKQKLKTKKSQGPH